MIEAVVALYDDVGESVKITATGTIERVLESTTTEVHEYIYTGGKLLRETYGSNVLDFFYDASGTLVAMRQSYTNSNNYTVYYYITNLQGDVVAILNSSGTSVVAYTYDSWGNILAMTGSKAMTLGRLNSLRYRGYVFDQDTELYYLQSRYYDPQVGRFINADALASTGQGLLGFNMFAYCCNNPVVFQDESGHNSALVDGIRGALWTLPLVDGPSVVGDIVCIIGLVALYLYDQAQTEEKTATVTSKSIDWNGGDKNHILKGTGKSHINGWKRFGIDPNKNGSWELLLPILMEVVDDADRVDPKQLPDGSMIILYFKTYAEQGVEVMVKIWVDITGYIQQISDAIPYIID